MATNENDAAKASKATQPLIALQEILNDVRGSSTLSQRSRKQMDGAAGFFLGCFLACGLSAGFVVEKSALGVAADELEDVCLFRGAQGCHPKGLA